MHMHKLKYSSETERTKQAIHEFSDETIREINRGSPLSRNQNSIFYSTPHSILETIHTEFTIKQASNNTSQFFM